MPIPPTPSDPKRPGAPARTAPVLSLRQRLTAAMLGGIGAFWLRSLDIRILRLERYLDLKEAGKAVIVAAWHSQMLLVTPLAARYGASTLVSPSADGELGDRVARRLGIRTLRGDSRYNPTQALMGLVHTLRRGQDIGLFPDGPLGPRQEVKPGILALAGLSACPILPLGAAARGKMVLERSWDGYQLPFPRTRVVVAVGEPLQVAMPLDEASRQDYAVRLRAGLNEQTALAVERIAAGD